MNRALALSFVLVLITLNVLVFRAEVHAQGKVIYMPEREITTEKLIEVLKPAGQEPMPGMAGEPNCQAYQRELAAGTLPPSDSAQAGIEVLFTFDSAKLSPNATRVLAKLAAALKSAALGAYCFEIQGHTDSVGKKDYNLGLSKRRAESVVSYLVSKGGVAAGRLVAIGYGPANPIADNSTNQGRARNRRVQIRNLGPGQ